MNCPNCGSDVRGRFCTNCGSRVDEPVGGPTSLSRDSDATSVIQQSDLEELAARESQAQAAQEKEPAAAYDTPLTRMMAESSETRIIDPGVGASLEPAATPIEEPETATVGDAAVAEEPLGSGAGPSSTPAWGGTTVPPAPAAPSDYPSAAEPAPVLQRSSTPTRSAGGGQFFELPAVQGALAPLDAVGKQVVAWIGAALLIIGVFLPARTVSAFLISVSVTLWDYSGGEGLLLVLCALLSAALAYLWDFRWLWVTGGLALLIVLLAFLSALTSSFTHPSWGFVFLFLGALAILAAAAMKADTREDYSVDVMTKVNRTLGR